MRIHVLSVPRSLPPEGNHRLGFCLIVQRLHAAGSIGTTETKQNENYKSSCLKLHQTGSKVSGVGGYLEQVGLIDKGGAKYALKC